MTNPVLLMLDEPSAGVSPIVMKDLFTKLKAISKMGTSILVVEQNAKQALEISNLGFVLQNGKNLSLIHISEPTRRTPISFAVFCV